MTPFSTIAIPHRDVLEGKTTKDTFAADLWEVFKSRAPAEYLDPDIFFRKTYLAEGIKTLLSIVEKRLKKGEGAPVIQLQTPFGGGKTHTLIAIYHKLEKWRSKKIVFVGDKCDPKDVIIWEEMEKQLTGKVEKLKGGTSPSVEKLRELFEPYQPLVILIDEIIEYVIPASGITVGDSKLSTQVLSFIRSLTEMVRSLKNIVLIFTYPSRTEYDSHGQMLLDLLLQRTGRLEEVYTPVHEDEIASVIRRRLFSMVKESDAREIIENFVEYADQEKILPEGVEKHIYRERFIRSYPFQPEVIDVLYKRWGSFPKFQRARGTLWLLSLVIHSLRNSHKSYIRLGDFDLTNDRIREELIKHIGSEYNSVISQDITSPEAGTKKVDRALGDAYTPFSFGTVTAAATFMYSFSGGPERGAATDQIKLSSVDPPVPSSIVVEALSKLADPHYSMYWDKRDEKYFFTTEITLARMLITKIRSVEERKENLVEEEKRDLSKGLSKEYFEIYIWPKQSKDISDNSRRKLVVLQNRDEKKCVEFLKNCGERPRVNRNTLIFLCPMESERINFDNFLKEKLAWQLIERDKTLSLTPEQKKEVKERIKKVENESKDNIRNLYRAILLPSKDGLKDIGLGIPTYGTEITIDKEIYERLRSDVEILERLAPLSLKEKYLRDRDYVETKKILESFFRTPGEIRIVSEEVFRNCIKEGVQQGLFGVGEIENEKPICRYFKVEFSPALVEGEILINAELCKPKERISDEELQSYIKKIQQAREIKSLEKVVKDVPWDVLSAEQKERVRSEEERRRGEIEGKKPPSDKYRSISFKLNVPLGKLSAVAGMVNYISTQFSRVNVRVEISALEGEIGTSDYDGKIRETINQAGINVEEEELK